MYVCMYVYIHKHTRLSLYLYDSLPLPHAFRGKKTQYQRSLWGYNLYNAILMGNCGNSLYVLQRVTKLPPPTAVSECVLLYQ